MENKTVEWKKNWKDKYLKGVVAFANSKTGGTLSTGVDDKGNAVGVERPKDTLKDVSDTTINKLGLLTQVSIKKPTLSKSWFLRLPFQSILTGNIM